MSTVHIFLVENDLQWRDRLWVTLSMHPDLQMLGAVCSREEAMEQFMQADVVIMDSEIEGSYQESMRLAKDMNRLSPANIIMMTDRYDMDSMLDGMLAGVKRFVSKANYSDLPRVIREISTKRAESGFPKLQ